MGRIRGRLADWAFWILQQIATSLELPILTNFQEGSHCLLKSPALGTYKPLQHFPAEAVMVHATSSNFDLQVWVTLGSPKMEKKGMA